MSKGYKPRLGRFPETSIDDTERGRKRDVYSYKTNSQRERERERERERCIEAHI